MDQKKVLFIILSLLLISSVTLGFSQHEQKVGRVREMLENLPSLQQVEAMDLANQKDAYLATQEAYDAYMALDAYEQSPLKGSLENALVLLEYFNRQVMPLTEP